MTWLALSEKEKEEVINYCNEKLQKNKPDMRTELGEPCYLDAECNMINISEVIEGVWLMGAKNNKNGK